jgi:hypothetical protein
MQNGLGNKNAINAGEAYYRYDIALEIGRFMPRRICTPLAIKRSTRDFGNARK